MGLNKDKRAFVRIDGSGRIVPGSLIFRKSKPKTGKWKEISGYECCNGLELFYTPDSFPIIFPQIALLCDGIMVDYKFLVGEYADIHILVDALNAGESNAYGYYAVQSNGSIKLTVPNAVKQQFCPSGTLTFFVSAS